MSRGFGKVEWELLDELEWIGMVMVVLCEFFVVEKEVC